jgi:tetratricopeptide (TPR) repeat protein
VRGWRVFALACGIAAAGLGGARAAAPDAAAVLAPLEAAVAADPDNLRPASEYRQAVIRLGEYDRALAFFEKLVAAHPRSANAWLSYGYAYVDKIPAAGAITQVILANDAVTQFSKSIELDRSWLALYTRGNSYLYWPTVFGRAPLGIADLQEAIAIAKRAPKKKKIYARAWVALGEGYWKTGEPEKAKATWREGLQLFPGDPRLTACLAKNGDDLDAYIGEHLDPHKRVDTNLAPLWEEE